MTLPGLRHSTLITVTEAWVHRQGQTAFEPFWTGWMTSTSELTLTSHRTGLSRGASYNQVTVCKTRGTVKVQLPSGNTQDPDSDVPRISASQPSKKTTRTGFLSGLKLWKKEDATVSVGGKEVEGSLIATWTWIEGRQRRMKEELVRDQAVAD